MKEERSRVKRALGVAGDAVFALVLLFCICAAAVLLCLRGEGLAGAKLGIVQSRSMEPGLRVGDVVRVLREGEYARGQIIVFYRATDLYAGAADAADLGSRPVWIHEIIERKTLPDGRIGYLTKGSANASDDGAYVPQDFVLGRALPLPPFWSRAVGFVASVKGIVLLVLLPCAVMLVLLSRDLVCILLEPPERTFYRKSFTARLILAPSEVKSRYLAVKNELLSYRDCRARTSWKAESFRVRGKPFAKLDIRGRTLKLCLALPPEQAAERKYGIEDGSARAAFRDFPSIMRIRSARAVNYAKQLITLAALFHGFERTENPAPALLPPEMTRRQMLRAGLLRRTTMRRPFPSKEPR